MLTLYALSILGAWAAMAVAEERKLMELSAGVRIVISLIWPLVFFSYALYVVILIGSALEAFTDKEQRP